MRRSEYPPAGRSLNAHSTRARSIAGGVATGAQVTVAIGGMASMAGAVWFWAQLPKIRMEARRLIVAQAIAGGEPSEMTAQAVED